MSFDHLFRLHNGINRKRPIHDIVEVAGGSRSRYNAIKNYTVFNYLPIYDFCEDQN